MKVAIVTHKLLHNYGGVLQAYALQKALRELGHTPIGIDCVPPLMSRHRYLLANIKTCLFETSPSPRDTKQCRIPYSA